MGGEEHWDLSVKREGTTGGRCNIDNEDGTENDPRTQGINDDNSRERSGAEGTRTEDQKRATRHKHQRTKEVKKPGQEQGQGGREGTQ